MARENKGEKRRWTYHLIACSYLVTEGAQRAFPFFRHSSASERDGIAHESEEEWGNERGDGEVGDGEVEVRRWREIEK